MDSNQIMMKEIRAVLTEDENADYSDSKAVRAILDRIREGKLNSTFYGKNYEKQVAKAIVEGPEDYVCLICKKPSSPRMVCEECRNKIFPNRDRTIEDKPEEATEPEIMPEPEISAEPEVVPEPEISAEPKVIPEPEISAEPEVVPEPEISAEPEVMPETEITVDTGAVYPQESIDPDEGEAAGIEIDEETLSAMSVSEVEDDAEEVKSIENEPLTETPAEETGPSVQELFAGDLPDENEPSVQELFAGDLSVENEMTPQELFSEATPQEFFTAATPADEIPPQQLMKKDDAGEPESDSTLTKDITGKLGDAVDKFTEKINVMAGGSGKVDLRLRDLFSGVFKRHDSGEAEKIFICGTKETTPDRANISAEWPKPWLYTRVFLVLFITFVLLMLCYTIFKNTNVIPGIIFVGSACVPFSVLVFLFEINAPRNISIFEVARVFCLGGAASLFVTLILYIFEGAQNGIIEAILIGIIEEAGKLLIVAFLIGHRPKNNYIL
ncbi:MAG: hypothetical protein K6F99_03285, partial [Lachnospiraceae bacterium]|nr:hypothetical protein [Lachnospiraceae bacterium]